MSGRIPARHNPFQSVNVQEFTADGTWHKPAGAKIVEVTLIGGGGGGGSAAVKTAADATASKIRRESSRLHRGASSEAPLCVCAVSLTVHQAGPVMF
jgi:hypothetical protein